MGVGKIFTGLMIPFPGLLRLFFNEVPDAIYEKHT